MKLRQLNTLDPTVDLLTQWDRLADGIPFRSWPWLASWWDAYGPGRQLLTMAVEDDQSEIIGLIPLCVERHAGGRLVRFLGGGQACSDYMSALAHRNDHPQVAQILAEWLLGSGEVDCSTEPRSWDWLDLSAIDQQDPFVEQLIIQMRSRGCHIDRRPGPTCWRIELPESWEAYLAQHSKSHRKQIRRVDRRYLESGTAQLHTVGSPDEFPKAWELLIDLHQQRRQSLGQAGCFANPRMSHFLWQASRRLLREGKLELHWLELEGKPVAAEMHLLGGGVCYAYQAGMDPASLDAEPGRIILIATIKRAIELGRSGFDFLRGDEPYKAHWRATPRPTWHYRIVSPRALPRLRHGVRRAGEEMKGWLKTGLSAVGVLSQSETQPPQREGGQQNA